MTTDAHAGNFGDGERKPDLKVVVFASARTLDPVLNAPFALTHDLIHRVTLSRARRQPLYLALEREEVKVRGERRGISLDEWKALMDIWRQKESIEENLSPTPRFERWLAHTNTKRMATDAARTVTFAWQRLTRGWDDRSLWSLDWYLCRTLGAQLTELAEISHGWPGNDEFPEFEDWQEALRHHGAVLTAAAVNDGTADDDHDEEALREAAQQSMRWVADHLNNLWD